MFYFQHVVEDGTVDEIKDCVLAIVCLPPLTSKLNMHITSRPIIGLACRLHARWSVEIEQELQAMHGIQKRAKALHGRARLRPAVVTTA